MARLRPGTLALLGLNLCASPPRPLLMSVNRLTKDGPVLSHSGPAHLTVRTGDPPLLPYALSATKWRGYDPGGSHHPPHCWYRRHKEIVQGNSAVPGPPSLEALRQELGGAQYALDKPFQSASPAGTYQVPHGEIAEEVPPRGTPLGDENGVRLPRTIILKNQNNYI
jgi:hypothetical protein